MSAPTQSPIFGATIAATLTGINGLAINGALQSSVIDLSTLPALSGLASSSIPANVIPDDVLLDFFIKTASGTLGSGPAVNWFVGAIAQGTNYPAGLTGVAGSYTVPSVGGLAQPIYIQGINASATTDYEGPVSIYSWFGFVPKKIIVVVQNLTGLALDATAGGGCNVTPVYYQLPTY